MSTKICATCRVNPAVKKVTTARVGHHIWKCQSCIDRKTVSFLRIKHVNRMQRA